MLRQEPQIWNRKDLANRINFDTEFSFWVWCSRQTYGSDPTHAALTPAESGMARQVSP